MSNMAGGFPLVVNDVPVRTSEALYQACRFPHLPEVQKVIIDQRSPMTAKMKGKPYRDVSRSDWENVRINIMRWCLRVKLAQNWTAFGHLLLETNTRPIVEQSAKDDFWGAKPVDDNSLSGMNVLGRLLMELRESVKTGPPKMFGEVRPLRIPDFLLFGHPIEWVRSQSGYRPGSGDHQQPKPILTPNVDSQSAEVGLFDEINKIGEDGPSRVVDQASITTELERYPHYRESGVEWIGEVPTHWETQRLKRLAWNVSEQTSERAKGMGYIALEHVESWTGRVTNESADSGDGQLKRFESGDVLFGKLRPYLAKVVHAKSPGLCVGEFLVLRMRMGISPRFLAYMLRSKPAIDWINGSTFGARMPRADWAFVGDTSFPVPSPTEQGTIARFLDHGTSRIDRYVRAKEKLIALLEEQKRAVIHEAITGRVDVCTGKPYEAYKPSGVKWLGGVPAHWDVRAAKWHLREVDERSVTGAEEMLSVSHLTGVTPRSEKNVTMFEAESNVGHKLCEPGDVVINTMWAWMGALGIAQQSGLVSPSYAVYRPMDDSSLDRRYAELMLRSAPLRCEYVRRSTGIRPSRLGLYPDTFLRIRLIAPPPEEQSAIVAFVARETTRCDRASKLMTEEVTALQEYRARLVADVVTGKLDVRQAAADLDEQSVTGGIGVSRDGPDSNWRVAQRDTAVEKSL